MYQSFKTQGSLRPEVTTWVCPESFIESTGTKSGFTNYLDVAKSHNWLES
jgi:hypothetical protein